MQKRWFRYLLAVMFGVMLLPVTAFARDHDRDWDHHHGRYDRHYNNRYYNNQYNRRGYWGNNSWGNNAYWGNGYYGSNRCVDPDGDGDCDHIRHHHHGYYQNGWWGNGYYPNTSGWWGSGYPNVYGPNGYYVAPNTWGSPYVYNQRKWGNSNTPPGWQRGRKRGWGNSAVPPGLAKKGWW